MSKPHPANRLSQTHPVVALVGVIVGSGLFGAGLALQIVSSWRSGSGSACFLLSAAIFVSMSIWQNLPRRAQAHTNEEFQA